MPSCNQQNYPINCNFRRASSKHLITLTPKIYPFFLKSLSKISSANGLPGILPVGQVRRQSYLPEPKIYLSRTTGRGLFPALIATMHFFAHVTHLSYIADHEGKQTWQLVINKGANIFHKECKSMWHHGIAVDPGLLGNVTQLVTLV